MNIPKITLMLERVTEGGEPTGTGRLIAFEQPAGETWKSVLDIVEFEARWACHGVRALAERGAALPHVVTYGSHEYAADELSLAEMIEVLLGSDPADLDRDRETEAFLGSGI